MCQFFSFVTEGDGILRYFNWEQRKRILEEKLLSPTEQSISEADSHSEICLYYNLDCDKVNKYEYNFLTKQFTIDQINLKTKNDSKICEEKVKKLRVKKIVEPLNMKKIINPVKIKKPKIELEEAVSLLKKWDSIEYSTEYSNRRSIDYSINCSIGASVGVSVGASAEASVIASVRDSVEDLIRVTVNYSVMGSVRDSIKAYISSFFSIEYEFDFSSCVKLWESGYVPSFDGITWYLHGYKGKILWQGKGKLK